MIYYSTKVLGSTYNTFIDCLNNVYFITLLKFIWRMILWDDLAIRTRELIFWESLMKLIDLGQNKTSVLIHRKFQAFNILEVYTKSNNYT